MEPAIRKARDRAKTEAIASLLFESGIAKDNEIPAGKLKAFYGNLTELEQAEFDAGLEELVEEGTLGAEGDPPWETFIVTELALTRMQEIAQAPQRNSGIRF